MIARLIISKNRTRTILLEAKIVEKLAEKDGFLNHSATLSAINSAQWLAAINIEVCSAKKQLPHSTLKHSQKKIF